MSGRTRSRAIGRKSPYDLHFCTSTGAPEVPSITSPFAKESRKVRGTTRYREQEGNGQVTRFCGARIGAVYAIQD
jgi:hypothetical protein